MLFNPDGTNTSHFYYKGDLYQSGTVVTIKDEYINKHSYNGKKIWKYAKYAYKISGSNGTILYFYRVDTHWKVPYTEYLNMYTKKDYIDVFSIQSCYVEDMIDEFIHPIMLPRETTDAIKMALVDPKRNVDKTKLRWLWAVYIVISIGSLIFNDFVLIWFVETLIFNKCRKDILNNDY